MFDHHRFGRDFSLKPQRNFLLLLRLWRGLGHKLLHAKFQTCSFLHLTAGAAKVTCPNVLNSLTKICIIGRVALLRGVRKGVSRGFNPFGFYTVLETLRNGNFRFPESGICHGTGHILNFYLGYIIVSHMIVILITLI